MSAGTLRGTRGRWASTGAAVLSAVGLVACGGSSSPGTSKPVPHRTLDTARVALAIQQSILSERHIHAKVVCPPNIPQEKGLTFTCVATTYTKKHRPVHTMFTVSQTDGAGHVYYQSPK